MTMNMEAWNFISAIPSWVWLSILSFAVILMIIGALLSNSKSRKAGE